jgi:hypothetical protein
MRIAKIDRNFVFKTIDSNNNDLELKHSGKQIAFLNVNKQSFAGDCPFLMIQKNTGSGYFVSGCYGFGGLGWRGHISTQKVLFGLKKLGFDINARQLNKWIRS